MFDFCIFNFLKNGISTIYLAIVFLLAMPKMNLNKGLFGVRKWQFERLGDIELLCEISILSSWETSGLCRLC